MIFENNLHIDKIKKNTAVDYLFDSKLYDITLPTRIDLFKDIEKNILKNGKHAHTLIHIAIDDYDDISDYFGVDVARAIVSQLSQWMKENLPTRNSKLYRFEMDKFAIYVTSRTKIKDIDDYVKMLINKITKKSFYVQENVYNISISVGVARGRRDIFKRSFLALSYARKGDKTYVFFSHKEKIEEKFLKNIKTHQEVKEAIENNKIVAVFQPIYNPNTSSIEKYETLMRIVNNDGSYKMPMEFLDVAKKVKLYSILTKKMIEIALAQIKKSYLPLTINLSIDDIENQSVTKYIYNTVKRSGLGEYITFEILETEEIKSIVKVSNFIKKMKELGCTFAIDDFGSGYSNFDHIIKLNVDYLKIDGSLVKNVDTSKECEIFVKTIIGFAKELGIQTVAEYVYNKSVFDKVKALGVDFVQGNYIGKAKSLSM